jgi:OOP family OmpA-OmpF porin
MKSQNLIICLIAILATAGCVRPLPRQEPLPVTPTRFTDNELRDVDNIFILADASGSMYMEKTFPEAKALSTSFIEALPERSARSRSDQYNVGYMAFGGDDRVRVDLAPFDRARLLAASEEAHIMGQMDGTGGTTRIDTVLKDVARQLEPKRGKSAILLLSDGKATYPGDVLAGATAIVEGRRDPVCIHTIQVGNDRVGEEFLRELSALSPCGSARNAASIDNSAAFESYAKALVVGAAPLPDVAAAPPVAGPCGGRIRLRGIEFGFDKAEVDEVSGVVLDTAISTLSGCPKVQVQIDGYTDSMGPEDYNKSLSERRAKAVRKYFTSSGISADRLDTQGYGESRPVASNDTREGRALNRRVELAPKD